MGIQGSPYLGGEPGSDTLLAQACGLVAVSPETSVFSSAKWTSVSGSQPRTVLPPPGDTVWYLGSSVVATTRCAPGIEWGALGVLLKFLQCTGQTPP